MGAQGYGTAPGRNQQTASAPPAKARLANPKPLVATAMKARRPKKGK
jgi:hypothetical protein